MNPSELAGVHRLSEALRDRIHVWIALSYPDRDTELEIVRMHCRRYNLPKDVLDKVYTIVSRTRNHPELEKPASIRSTIAIAKLVAERARKTGNYDDDTIAEAAFNVLVGTLKARPGIRVEAVAKSIIMEALKHKR